MGKVEHRADLSPLVSRPTSRGNAVNEVSERQHIGLSDATRRENMKKELYEHQLDQAHHGTDKKRGGTLDPLSNPCSNPNDVAEALGIIKPEEFQQETNNLDHRIEDMSKSVRLDHLGDAKMGEDKAKKEREEARKQKEAELRRARKREQEARNPQRKVALRLENKRRFETEAGEDKEIPMMRMEVSNANSRATVSLVDVRMLRSRCKMLDEGINVRDMMDRDKQKEMWEKMTQDRMAQISLRSAVSAPGLLQDMTYEQRLKTVVARKEANHVHGIIRQLSSCRNTLPYKLPYRFDVKKGDDLSDLGNRRLTIAPPMGGSSGREAHVASMLAVRFASEQQGSINAPESAEVQKLMGELGRVVVVQEEARKHTRRKSSLRRSEMDNRKAMAMRVRQRRLWAIARATVKVLGLFTHVTRRQGAVECVTNILKQLGEWARVRSSIKRLIQSIKVLQGMCRTYQEYKKRRCEQLQREWLRVEDQHLSAYFKTYSQKMVKEMKEAADKPGAKERRLSLATRKEMRAANKVPPVDNLNATKKKELIQLMEDGVQTGSLQIDWKSYRIPSRDRWAIVNAFYLNRLKKHVRSKGSFLAAVKARVDNEKEMVNFLQSFGANEVAVREFQQSGIPKEQVSPPAFWHLTEDLILRMIALAAQSMVGEAPFMDHPANKDVPQDMYKSRSAVVIPTDADAISSGKAATMRAMALLRRLDRPEWTVSLGRLKWQPKRKNSTIRPEPVLQTEVVQKNTRVTIDEVFNRFTPRLREIAEVQTTKTRASIRKDVTGAEAEA